MIPSSNGTYPSPICSSFSSLDDGAHVTKTSTADPVPIVRSLIHSPSSVAVARGLRGEEAQELIDTIDQVTGVPELEEKLWKQCLHLLYKMCKDCKMLPASYILQEGSLCVGALYSYGGFADVSTGVYMGHRVAIKNLRFWTKDPSNKIFKRFCREIIVWKGLSHPGVLPLLGVSFSMDPHCFRMVSPWMQNGNVMEYTRSNPAANRLQLLSGIMSGVSYLHDLGVIHGDLKGANILVDDDGTALLADFGLATISVDLSSTSLSATIISSAGTIPWMSPELLFGHDSSPTQESDIYALGMVVYEVLTGHRPFHRLAPWAVVIAVQKGGRPRRPVNAGLLGFSDRLWKLVLRSWDESPSTRPTARALLCYLQGASPTWAPPLEYPIPDDPDGEAGFDLMPHGEWSVVADALTNSFFAPLIVMLCIFVLSL